MAGELTTGPVWWPRIVTLALQRALAANVEVKHAIRIIRARGLLPETTSGELESWPWGLRVRVLGGFEVEREGKAVRFTAKSKRKPFELLQTLIAYGGRGVHEYRLTEALWPDADGATAHQSFATTLHRLQGGRQGLPRVERRLLDP